MSKVSLHEKYAEKYFVVKYLIEVLHCIECWILPKLYSDEIVVNNYYSRRHNGERINVENPQTFSEKSNWYKLYGKKPLMQQVADKYAVREYIESKGYGDTLNKLIGVYDKVSDIDIESLPDRFVLKAAHGSHMNIVVNNNKDKFNWRREKELMKLWLKRDIYFGGREWVYKDMPKRIVIEDFLEDQYGELRDYKFFCFNGKPSIMYIATDRFGEAKNTFFDMDFNKLDLASASHPIDEGTFAKPETFEKMKKMAADLSEPFQFVRVDLYDVNGKIYFGEMTFYQDGGDPGYSPEWDKRLGDLWKTEK